MGRHAGPAPVERGPGLGEVVGWGAFTFVLVVGALVFLDVPLPVVLGVGGTVLAGLGAAAAAMALSPRRPPGATGSPPAPGHDDDPRVP